MNVLVAGTDSYLFSEFNDFLTATGFTPYFAENNRKAIKILNSVEINIIVLEIKTLKELNLLKYINDNHKTVQVILITEKNFKEQISIIRNADYLLLQKPFRLSELITHLREKVENENIRSNS